MTGLQPLWFNTKTRSLFFPYYEIWIINVKWFLGWNLWNSPKLMDPLRQDWTRFVYGWLLMNACWHVHMMRVTNQLFPQIITCKYTTPFETDPSAIRPVYVKIDPKTNLHTKPSVYMELVYLRLKGLYVLTCGLKYRTGSRPDKRYYRIVSKSLVY